MKSLIETQIEIFTLLLDGARRRAYELIKTLDARACQTLRAAAETLDSLTIDAFFDRQRERRMKQKETEGE